MGIELNPVADDQARAGREASSARATGSEKTESNP